MPRRFVDWDEYIEDLADRILDSLDFFCWEITGDTPLECYRTHSDADPYELANEFLGEGEYSSWKVREKDLRMIRQMPESYYKKLKAKLSKEINRKIRELEKEYGETEEEW